MSELKNEIIALVIVLSLIGAAWFFGGRYAKSKLIAEINAQKPQITHTTDTLYVPVPEIRYVTTAKIVRDTISADTTAYIASTDTAFADGAEIGVQYFHPRGDFDITYQPAPKEIIYDTVKVEYPPIIEETGASFREVVLYIGGAFVAGYIVHDIVDTRLK